MQYGVWPTHMYSQFGQPNKFAVSDMTKTQQLWFVRGYQVHSAYADYPNLR